MAKIFGWRINDTNSYAYLCNVPDPNTSETHISTKIVDQKAIDAIVDFLSTKTDNEIKSLYSEMKAEVDRMFGTNDLPTPEEYGSPSKFPNYWSNNGSTNRVIYISGKDGIDGLNGTGSGGSNTDVSGSTTGPQGPRGFSGTDGAQGPKGENGNDGRDGRDGAPGANAPYFELYYFAAPSAYAPDSQGHPTGGIVPIFEEGVDDAPYWGTSMADRINSHKCTKHIPLIGPDVPYRYTTQRFYDGYNFGEFQPFILDAAYINPVLGETELNAIAAGVEANINTRLDEAVASMQETKDEFQNLKISLSGIYITINDSFDEVTEIRNLVNEANERVNEARDNSQAALDRAVQAFEDAERVTGQAQAASQEALTKATSALTSARNTVTETRAALSGISGTIQTAIEDIQGVVNGVTADTESLRASFSSFSGDVASFSGVMTEFAVSASGIFQESLLATSGLSAATMMAHNFSSTVSGLQSDIQECITSGNLVSQRISNFRQDIEGIETNLSDLRQSGDSISARTAELSFSISGLQTDLRQVYEDNEGLVVYAANLAGTISGLSQTISRYQEDLETTYGYYSSLSNNISGLTHHVEAIKTDVSGFSSTTIARLEHTVEGLRDTITALDASGNSISAKTAELAFSISGLQVDLKQVFDDNGELITYAANLAGTISGLSQTISRYQEDLNYTYGYYSSLVNNISGLTSHVEAIKTDVSGFSSTTIAELSNTISGLSHNITVLNQDLDSTEVTYSSLVNSVSGLTSRLEEIKTNASGFSSVTLSQLSNAIEGFRQQVDSLVVISGGDMTLTISSLQNTLSGLQSDMQQLITRGENFSSTTLSSLKNDLEGFQTSVSNLTTSGENLTYNLSTLENTLSGLQSDVQQVITSGENFSSTTLSSLKNDLEGFQTSVANITTSGENLSYSLSRLEATVGRISAELTEAELSGDTFSARLARAELATSGLTTKVSATESGITSAWTAFSELNQTVSGIQFTIEQSDGQSLADVNLKIGTLSGAVGTKITALSATSSSITASLNEMRNDYNQFVVTSSEWKKNSNGQFVSKSWDEDKMSVPIVNYAYENTSIPNCIFYAKNENITPRCLYARYPSGINPNNEWSRVLSGYFYTDKEETIVFDGNIHSGSSVINIYEKAVTAGTIFSGFRPYTNYPRDVSLLIEENNGIMTSYPQIGVYMLAEDTGTPGWHYTAGGSLGSVYTITSAQEDAHDINTYYSILTTATTEVCGNAVTVSDFIIEHAYSVLTEFSGVKQTPTAINQWVKNQDTAAQIALGINGSQSSVGISADHIYMSGGTLQAQFNGVNIVSAINRAKNTDGSNIPYNTAGTYSWSQTGTVLNYIRQNNSTLSQNQRQENSLWVFNRTSGGQVVSTEEYVVTFPDGDRSKAIFTYVGEYDPNAGGVLQIDAERVDITGELIASKLSAHTGTIAGINFHDEKIQSSNFTSSNGSQGFCIDMANGVISANTIYLGGGGSSSGSDSGSVSFSGIQLDTMYETSGASFMFGSDGLLMAKNAMLEGSIVATNGYIGGIKVYDNTIEGKRFTLDNNGRLFASGLEIAGDGLVINKNEIMFSKKTASGEDIVLDVNGKGYLLPSDFGSTTKDANIISAITNVNHNTIITSTKYSTGATEVSLGGDNFKGALFVCSATSDYGLSSLIFKGRVQYTVKVTRANYSVNSGGGGYSAPSYNSSSSSPSPYGGGGYGSDNPTNTDGRDSILLKYGDLQMNGLFLHTNTGNTRQGTITVYCSTGYTWIATSNDCLIDNTTYETGSSGENFKIKFVSGQTEGTYYIDVDYYTEDGTSTGLGGRITIYNENAITGTGENWLDIVSASSSRSKKKNEDLALPLTVDLNSITSEYKNNSNVNDDDIVLGNSNVIKNETLLSETNEVIIKKSNDRDLVLGAGGIADGVTYRIELEPTNTYLVKDNDRVKTVYGEFVSGTSEISTIVDIESEFDLNRTTNGAYYALGIGSEVTGKVKFTSPNTNTRIAETTVVCEVKLLSGFTLESKPLSDYTEIFSNGLGYFGDSKNFFVVQNSPGKGLSFSVKRCGQYVLGNAQVIDISAGTNIKLNELTSRRVIIKGSSNSNISINIHLPGTQRNYGLLGLESGDEFEFFVWNVNQSSTISLLVRVSLESESDSERIYVGSDIITGYKQLYSDVHFAHLKLVYLASTLEGYTTVRDWMVVKY